MPGPGSASWFLALRYLKPRQSLVSVITLMSVMGPILGVAVLIIVISVMSGFSHNIREKILGMQAHIQITDPMDGVIEDPEPALKALKEAGLYASPVVEGPVLIQTTDQVLAKYVKGIDPKREKTVSDIHKHIQDGGRFEIEEHEILIGREMAFLSGLHVGDKLIIHSPEKLTKMVKFDENGQVQQQEEQNFYAPEELTIAGIFNLGMYEYDSSFIFMHLEKANDLFGMDWGAATVIQVKTQSPFDLAPIMQDLRTKEELTGLRLITWEQANERLFSALAVEKNMMFFLLIFIVLVAAFGIANTLITIVIQKTREIGVLKAIGASPTDILSVFVWQGAIVGFVGTLGGTALGLIVLEFRNGIAEFLGRRLGVEIFPAAVYNLDGIPAVVSPTDLALIAGLSFLLCVGASLIPALYAAFMTPSKALRSEGS